MHLPQLTLRFTFTAIFFGMMMKGVSALPVPDPAPEPIPAELSQASGQEDCCYVGTIWYFFSFLPVDECEWVGYTVCWLFM